jgi:phosphate transport system substrate-binding protein
MRTRMLWTVALLALAAITGCNSPATPGSTGTPGSPPLPGSTPAGGSSTSISGDGSSFVQPLMVEWVKQYELKTGAKVGYTAVGSTTGIKDMSEDRMAFGCTDAPMTKNQMDKAPTAIHVPLVMGAVVPIYNIPDVKGLHLNGDVLARIYLGEITTWDHDDIKALNKDATLPKEKIGTVRRADGSGTTYIFTSFLHDASKSWTDAPNTKPDWKIKGLAKEKNAGVAQAVSDTPFSIGYVELLYAIEQQDAGKPLNIAQVANKDGKYVAASVESVKKAAAVALKEKGIPEDLRQLSIINPKGEEVFPISGVVFAVCKTTVPNGQGKAVKDFLHWCLTTGQGMVGSKYAPLPEELAKASLKVLDKVQ